MSNDIVCAHYQTLERTLNAQIFLVYSSLITLSFAFLFIFTTCVHT